MIDAMRPLFTTPSVKRPKLVSMITEYTPEECVDSMRNSIYDGADAFAVHLDILRREYHDPEHLERIYNTACDLPIMSIDYRRNDRPEVTDDVIAEEQLTAIKAGASMCDIMGDLFGEEKLQLSKDPAVIKKQRDLVDKIHSLGGEVLMSSHTWVPMTAEETLAHAKALASRGADMVKIAMCAHSPEDMLEVIRTTHIVSNELEVPFLHVCMGQYGKVHRVIAPTLGSALVLCVQRYSGASHKDQPLLRAVREIYNNLDWHINRNDMAGAIQQKHA